MSNFSEMGKWDWENISSFPTDIPKKLQLPDWMIVDGGDIDSGPYNISKSGGGHNPCAKSSVSASMDFRFKGNEQLIGLKLGKRTYFENNTNFSVMPMPTPSLKKNRSTGSICCQVEGCEMDLSGAKEYHLKHRVCDSHSKSPKVIVGGLERRFCQQCSRFHGLSDFDEKKRSCRRRLSDHNARRRKPQPETILFNSTRSLSSAYYEGIQKVGFPPAHSSWTPANSTWDRETNHKFTLTNGYPLKSDGGGQLHTSRMKFPNPINVQYGAKGFFASKNHSSDVFNPGSRGSSLAFPPSPVTEPDSALSLLSNNSWDSCEPGHVPLMHQSDSSIHTIPEGVPLSSPEFWLNGHPNIQSLGAGSNFQEFQLFKSPYEADFYSGILN